MPLNYTHSSGGGSSNAPSYEMEGRNSMGGGSMDDYFGEISAIQDAIRTFNDQVQNISDLHNRQLTALDADPNSTASTVSSDLATASSSISTLSNSIKQRIKTLERQTVRLPATNPDKSVRQNQEGALKKRFMETIESYQGVEKAYRDRLRMRLERQYRIVKPDATEDEVRNAVDGDAGEGGVFAQALLGSRTTDARRALSAAQDRQKDIKKIEQTLVELAQLFNEMSIMVEQDDEKIVSIDERQALVGEELGMTIKELKQANVSARNYRRGRWICFFISVGVLVVVGIILAIVFGRK
ncbi:t-SNARE [Atractiella rhizophila]|nr:t-SNARE [Atractiella rhizophila]